MTDSAPPPDPPGSVPAGPVSAAGPRPAGYVEGGPRRCNWWNAGEHRIGGNKKIENTVQT